MDWKYDPNSLDGQVVKIIALCLDCPPEGIGITKYLEDDLFMDSDDELELINVLFSLIEFKYPNPIFSTWCVLQRDRLKNGEPAFRYYRVYDIVRAVWLSDPEASLSAGFPKEYLFQGYVEE